MRVFPGAKLSQIEWCCHAFETASAASSINEGKNGDEHTGVWDRWEDHSEGQRDLKVWDLQHNTWSDWLEVLIGNRVGGVVWPVSERLFRHCQLHTNYPPPPLYVSLKGSAQRARSRHVRHGTLGRKVTLLSFTPLCVIRAWIKMKALCNVQQNHLLGYKRSLWLNVIFSLGFGDITNTFWCCYLCPLHLEPRTLLLPGVHYILKYSSHTSTDLGVVRASVHVLRKCSPGAESSRAPSERDDLGAV